MILYFSGHDSSCSIRLHPLTKSFLGLLGLRMTRLTHVRVTLKQLLAPAAGIEPV